MKKALVIGINEYPSHPLKGAVNDAKVISELLKVNGNDTTNFEVKPLYNVKTKSELLTEIAAFFEVSADMALLYFAGHGYVNELGGFIVTPDHKRYDEGISMDHILSLANGSKIRNKVIILDCCKSGSFAMPNGNGSITPIYSGISILTSSREDEPSKEINGHGIFTNLLIEGLKGGASDIRGHISPGGLYAYIDQALGAHEQRPVPSERRSRSGAGGRAGGRPQGDPAVRRRLRRERALPHRGAAGPDRQRVQRRARARVLRRRRGRRRGHRHRDRGGRPGLRGVLADPRGEQARHDAPAARRQRGTEAALPAAGGARRGDVLLLPVRTQRRQRCRLDDHPGRT